MNWLRCLVIKKLGGWVDAESAILSVEDETEKKRLLTLAVKKLYNTIGPEDILKLDAVTKQWMFKGKVLSESFKSRLIAEAEIFLESKLWEILQADVLYQANRKMYLHSQKDLDLVAGKLWAYTFDTLATRLESMKIGSANFNSKG
jgi:phage gp16-like protein